MIINNSIDNMQLMSELKEILCDTLEIDENEVTEDTDLIENHEVTSLMTIELLVELEKKYNIRFDENEMKTFKTLGNLFNSVSKKLGNI